jgi:hypothetical protein
MHKDNYTCTSWLIILKALEIFPRGYREKKKKPKTLGFIVNQWKSHFSLPRALKDLETKLVQSPVVIKHLFRDHNLGRTLFLALQLDAVPTTSVPSS